MRSGPTARTTTSTSLLTDESRRATTSDTDRCAASRRIFAAAVTIRARLVVLLARTTTRSGTGPSATDPPDALKVAAAVTALLSLHAAPLHGRGVRRAASVPVLHRPHRSGHRRGDANGQAEGVRGFAAFSGDDVPDPQAVETFLGSKLEPCEVDPLYRELLAPAPELPRELEVLEADDDRKLLRLRRGTIELVADFAAEAGRDSSLMEVWPGHPFPLGPTWDGRGTNFSIFTENAERVELCLFDDDGDGEDADPARSSATAFNWHCYIPGVGPASATATASTAPYDPRVGHALQPAQAPDRSVREGDRGAGRLERAPDVLPYVPSADERCGSLRATTRTTADAIPKCVVVDPTLRLGGRQRRPTHPWNETVIYEVHVRRASRSCTRSCARTCAARTPDSRPKPAIEHLTSLGVTAVELLPGPSHHRRELPARSRSDELLGLLRRSASSRRTRCYAATGDSRRAGARVQGDGEGAAPRRDRGDPRRRLQPHRRGQPPRPDARRSRASTTPRTTG